MAPGTLQEATACGFDVCINQCARLLSVHWWSLALGGGYPEVQAIRRVFKVSLSALARANGCHLPVDNDRLAKAMLGHVCFDAAMQAAARLLKAEWSICGGYALSCLTRFTGPHSKYRYVEQIFSLAEGKVSEDLWLVPHGNGMDKTFYWGDVDFFLTNTTGQEPTPDTMRQALQNAIAALKDCLTTVAAYGYGDQFQLGFDPADFHTADYVDRGYISGVRNFTIAQDLLGRPQRVQLILDDDPDCSAFKTVRWFDMTHCAVWIHEVALNRGEPELTLGFPCERWRRATAQRKGYMMVMPPRGTPLPREQRVQLREMLEKRKARRKKYRERGFTVKLRSLRRFEWLTPALMRISLA